MQICSEYYRVIYARKCSDFKVRVHQKYTGHVEIIVSRKITDKIARSNKNNWIINSTFQHIAYTLENYE